MARASEKNKWLTPRVKLAIKLALSALAMYIVFRKLEFKMVWELLRKSELTYLILALLLFNVSKFLSAARLRSILNALELRLNLKFHLRLCYVGMFYNLFLPGGIGGDGYKVVYLNKSFGTGLKLLLASVLLDRVGGAAILLSMAFAFSLAVLPFVDSLPWYSSYLCIAASILCIPALFIGIKLLFPSFWSARFGILLWSVGVQSVQLLCAYAILLAFGVSELFTVYFMLFLVSSLASMLPISFGGIGLRELFFLYAAKYLSIDETVAVSLGLMYFVVIALSSFAGVFISLPDSPEPEQAPSDAALMGEAAVQSARQ